MRKKINGRSYDTETAKRLGTYYTNGAVGINWTYNKEFFQKRNGEIFCKYNGTIYPDDTSGGNMKDQYLELLSKSKVFQSHIPNVAYSHYATTPFTVKYNDYIEV